MKVRQLDNKNQFIIESEEGVYFQSYDSIVALRTTQNLVLGADWDYSNTTRKHLYTFLKTYAYSIFEKIENATNKRLAILKLIDNGTIIYNGEMR